MAFDDPKFKTDWNAIALSDRVFGWCGCGQPVDALQWVYEQLKPFDNEDGLWRPSEEYKAAHSDGELNFFWYWLDNLEFTEHGGCVPGWLTFEGKRVLAALKRLDAEGTFSKPEPINADSEESGKETQS